MIEIGGGRGFRKGKDCNLHKQPWPMNEWHMYALDLSFKEQPLNYRFVNHKVKLIHRILWNISNVKYTPLGVTCMQYQKGRFWFLMWTDIDLAKQAGSNKKCIPFSSKPACYLNIPKGTINYRLSIFDYPNIMKKYNKCINSHIVTHILK